MTAPARRAIAALCGILTACLCWFASGPTRRIDAGSSEKPRPSKKEDTPAFRLIGVCELAAAEMVEVRLPLAAPVGELATPGQMVTKGQALARSDRRQLIEELRRAEADLAAAQARAASREAEFRQAQQVFREAESRQQTLQAELTRLEREAGAAGKLYREQASRADRAAEEAWEKFQSTQRRWRQTGTALEEAGTRAQQARTKLEQAEKQLADARAAHTAAQLAHDEAVRRLHAPEPVAPCSGRVRLCQIESGTLLVRLAREEVLIGQLQQDPAFSAPLPASCPVRLEGETGERQEATLTTVDGRAEVRVANPAGRLRPGMRLRVLMEMGP